MSNNKDWISATIIDDSDCSDSEVNIPSEETFEIEVHKKKKPTLKVILENVSKVPKKIPNALKIYFDENIHIIEIGVDEAGRGPMFGRVYAGAAVLPKDYTFEHSKMKDSKKFGKSKKGLKDICSCAEYIKENAIAYSVAYEDEQTIDTINILQATQSAMHKAIKDVLSQLNKKSPLNYDNILLLIDGNYFKPYTLLNSLKTKSITLRYNMIEGGDNKYTSIAAASILAKVERDKYIDDLCVENPELCERYGIDSNKGYGAKKHMDGIKQFGITKWHRKSFGICKEYC